MDGFGVGGHAGLLEGLREGRVGVAGAGQVLSAGSVLDADDCLADHLSSARTHDVGAQQFVGLLLGEDLDHSVGVGDGLGARVGQEGEHTLGVVDV